VPLYVLIPVTRQFVDAKINAAQQIEPMRHAQTDLPAIRGSVGTGGRGLRKNVAKLLRDARRDVEKMNKAVRRDLERPQKDLTSASAKAESSRAGRRAPRTTARTTRRGRS
jgi:hypothetical protein